MIINSNILISLLSGFGIYLVIFAIYLELAPGIGNVWYRVGVDGLKHIRLSHLFSFIIKPLSMIELWYPSNWDLNYFIGAGISSFLFYNLIKFDDIAN
jgi:hypothetical protein